MSLGFARRRWDSRRLSMSCSNISSLLGRHYKKRKETQQRDRRDSRERETVGIPHRGDGMGQRVSRTETRETDVLCLLISREENGRLPGDKPRGSPVPQQQICLLLHCQLSLPLSLLLSPPRGLAAAASGTTRPPRSVSLSERKKTLNPKP